MMIKELVNKCRSYRRFYEDERIEESILKDLVDLARMTASTANSQALVYRLVLSRRNAGNCFPALAGQELFSTGQDQRKESVPVPILLSAVIRH